MKHTYLGYRSNRNLHHHCRRNIEQRAGEVRGEEAQDGEVQDEGVQGEAALVRQVGTFHLPHTAVGETHLLSQRPGLAGRVWLQVVPHDWQWLPSPFRVYSGASFRPIIHRRDCWCTFVS